MAKASKHYLAALLEPWAHVEIKRMFGGLGAWRDGIFFALIVNDVIYFKVDATTRAEYAALNSEPFSYAIVKYGVKNLKIIDGLWRVPDEILEDGDALNAWAQKAWDIARLKPDKAIAKAEMNVDSTHEFKSLGRKALPMLCTIVVSSKQQLDALGAVETYKQLKARYPKDVSPSLLWTLYAVVNRMDVKDVTTDIKDHLKNLLTAV